MDGDSKSALEVWTARAKLGVHQTRRLLAWQLQPRDWKKPQTAGVFDDFTRRVYAKSVAIARQDLDADPRLETGKRINVALAAPYFDGLKLTREAPLSFWRALGRVTRARGYKDGMELRGGCIMPALGGGICLLSNALFEMAAHLGWTILERHGHSMEAAPPDPDPSSLWGLDATVLWPHVDLRFAPREGAVRIGARVVDGALELTADADRAWVERRVALRVEDDRVVASGAGRLRKNRIIRTIDGRDEILCDNQKRLLHQSARRRNCYTCDRGDCKARPIALRLAH